MATLYVCDRRSCAACSYPKCKYTADITHAEHFFVNEDGNFVEKEGLHAEFVDTPTDTLYTRYNED